MAQTIYRAEAREKPQAIETVYKNYRFRSRLEARWAVFFDTLGLSWAYEPEGFDLDGVWYLPDFRVKTPQGEDVWYEIKPEGVDFDAKFERFKEVLTYREGRAELLSGDPVDVIERAELCPRCGFIQMRRGHKLSGLCHDGFRSWHYIRCYGCDVETPSGGGHEPEPGFLGVWAWPDKGLIVTNILAWALCLRDRVRPAANKARQARFEHGARG